MAYSSLVSAAALTVPRQILKIVGLKPRGGFGGDSKRERRACVHKPAWSPLPRTDTDGWTLVLAGGSMPIASIVVKYAAQQLATSGGVG